MSLKSKVVWSVAWTSSSTLMIRLLGSLTILVLGKLLSPADFGLIAIMELTITSIMIFRDFGLAQALIRRQHDLYQAANTAFLLLIVWSGFLYLLLFWIAPWIATFFGEPEADLPIRVIGLTLLISSISVVPAAMLEKELAFKTKSLAEVWSNVVYSGLVIVLAGSGLGIWSVVCGRIIQAAILPILIWRAAAWQLKFYFNVQIAMEMLSYGWHLVTASILSVGFLYIDNMFVGGLLGSTALGFYTFGFMLANFPAQSINPIINKVAFPTFMKLQQDGSALSAIYLRAIRLISTAGFFVTVGTVILLPTLLKLIYGDKWDDSLVVIQILSIYSLFRILGSLATNLFYAIGKQHIVPRALVVLFFLVTFLLWPLTLAFGIIGTSLTMTGAMIVGVLFWLILANSYLQIPTRRFLQVLWPQSVASILITIGLLLFKSSLDQGLVTLLLFGLASFGIYLTTILLLDKGQLRRDVIQMIAALRS